MTSAGVDDYQEGLAISTGKTALIMLFLPPLFPFFMLYRIIKHRHYPHKRISDLKLIAIVLLMMFISLFLAAITYSPSAAVIISISLVTLLPSMILFGTASNKSNKMNERYILYRDSITQNGIASIEELARLAGQQPRVVRNELKHMIHDNLLSGYDIRHNQIIQFEKKWTGPAETPSPAHFAPSSRQASHAPKHKTVECHGCGASTTIMEGQVKRCEYCDSILS